MLPIGRWVLREALRCALRWRRAGWRTGPVAVNLSGTQFEAPGFVESVTSLLAQTGASGALLELELTERMLMSDLWNVRLMLQSLKSQGVSIAVDDFGTGYTSLAHLKDLPLDRLKIDRSFVKDLPQDPRSGAIAQAIVHLAHSLGLQVVAEGVETVAQREDLRDKGCDAMQGFLDARPMPAEAFEAWLQTQAAVP
jgi:EAL domain-containing protein (putative c-di-GMP-specific phosphodiesterase class I)